MRYRRLGNTGRDVSVIGLGTWQFGGELGREFSRRDVDVSVGRARELGVNHVDTAECYGDHLAESLIGRTIASERDRWVVATKFGHRLHAERMRQSGWEIPGGLRSDHWSPDDVVRQLEASLRSGRLGRRLPVAREAAGAIARWCDPVVSPRPRYRLGGARPGLVSLRAERAGRRFVVPSSSRTPGSEDTVALVHQQTRRLTADEQAADTLRRC